MAKEHYNGLAFPAKGKILKIPKPTCLQKRPFPVLSTKNFFPDNKCARSKCIKSSAKETMFCLQRTNWQSIFCVFSLPKDPFVFLSLIFF